MHIPDQVLVAIELATVLAGLVLLVRGVRTEHWQATISGALLGALPGLLLLTSTDFRAFANGVFGPLNLVEIGLLIALLGGVAGWRLGASSGPAIAFLMAGIAGGAIAALPGGMFLSRQSAAVLAVVGFFLFGFSGKKLAPVAAAVNGALLVWLGGVAVLERWWPVAAREVSANRGWTLVALAGLAAVGAVLQQGGRSKGAAGAPKRITAHAAA
ncbi:MAG: hypothetical protein AAB434_03115 [Planctomycetota bacterium]